MTVRGDCNLDDRKIIRLCLQATIVQYNSHMTADIAPVSPLYHSFLAPEQKVLHLMQPSAQNQNILFHNKRPKP